MRSSDRVANLHEVRAALRDSMRAHLHEAKAAKDRVAESQLETIAIKRALLAEVVGRLLEESSERSGAEWDDAGKEAAWLERATGVASSRLAERRLLEASDRLRLSAEEGGLRSLAEELQQSASGRRASGTAKEARPRERERTSA